jgi:alcohol dehydrogenase
VLVYGASGAVGTSAVQLARHFGATVTAACGPSNAELVRSLGAGEVLDYTKDAAPKAGDRYDLVLDAVGTRKTSALKVACAKALAPRGRYVSVDDGVPRFVADDLAALTKLVESGELRPVIDRSFSLEQISEAHAYVELGHKKGNVVITVA